MPDISRTFPMLQRGIRRLRLVFETWYPWDLKKVGGKVRALKFRPLEMNDIDWCLKLYARNERCGVPESGRALYEEYLESRDHRILIAEDSSGRVGTFGIHMADETTGYISYLLVDPGAHRSGVGTTMVLAAAALLGVDDREKHLMLTAFDTALPFYTRLAFARVMTEKHEGRPLHHLAHGPMPPMLIADYIEILRRSGVDPADLRLRIPFSKTPALPGNLDTEEELPY
jgi:ribosomal protein S18 acetylase RimI-like enzyme